MGVGVGVGVWVCGCLRDLTIKIGLGCVHGPSGLRGEGLVCE